MRFFSVLGTIFYAVIVSLIGLGLIALAVMLSLDKNPIAPQQIADTIAYLQVSFSSRAVMFLSGLLLCLISYSFAQLILGRFQRERTIAFSTATGEVTVALSAVEDLIKRLTGIMPEIRELRPDVIATKKGIIVDLRVVLKSDTNIPDLTARLQELTRSKIQEVLGIEEQIVVKIHISKIVGPDEKDRRRKEPIKEESTLPYGGYGRV